MTPRNPKNQLPHPWKGHNHEGGFPITLLPELIMRAASNAIREKPLWFEKFKDPLIAQRWQQELVANDHRLTEVHVRFIFQELEWYSKQRQDQIDQGIQHPIESAIDGTRRSDGLVSEGLKQRLLTCVEKLVNIPDHHKDWHPGSNNQVLNLIHPSLYPLVIGRSRVLPHGSKLTFPGLDALKKPSTPIQYRGFYQGRYEERYFSKKYQWLPTDVQISNEGQAKFLSYINNLHPVEHAEMYQVLEGILELFIPMFEQVLAEMLYIWDKTSRLNADESHWYDRSEEPEWPDEEEDNNDWNEWWDNLVPRYEIPEFRAPPTLPPFPLRDQKLQVIVKMANIELSPENPTYPGGTWHVEGMANEHIVATGIYYYHTENITESRLNFRINARNRGYCYEDPRGAELMYGIIDGQPLVQSLDGIVTKEDRCIVFPNIYQHQVQPFELDDKTRPGKRQILVFFLIDPQEMPRPSTSHVPPQQMDWARSLGLWEIIEERLPAEVMDRVVDFMDWPMNRSEALEHRSQLMMERKVFVDETNRSIFERPFSLCEH
ncbi:hypothetical protein BGZ83_010597 [Gryganskiella cystojenkinii]|nr:hypothetical protein BGZ83_010597 [Gryganskiella cystojenkinii]